MHVHVAMKAKNKYGSDTVLRFLGKEWVGQVKCPQDYSPCDFSLPKIEDFSWVPWKCFFFIY